MILLLLYDQGLLREPLFYPSLYFKAHQHEYYTLLNAVHIQGDWEGWLEFFAAALTKTADQAVETAQKLLAVVEDDQEKIKKLERTASSVLKIHTQLLQRPITTAQFLAQETNISLITVNQCLGHLINLGIITEMTSKKFNRVYKYDKYINALSLDIAANSHI